MSILNVYTKYDVISHLCHTINNNNNDKEEYDDDDDDDDEHER